MNRNQLKYLACAAMLADHIGWAFVPTASATGQALHLFGRLTGPIMAFFLAEGYRHTRSLSRYGLRLGLFALISWPAFSCFETGRWFSGEFGVMYTLFLGLLAMALWDRAPVSAPVKGLGVAGLCLLSLPGDWPVFDVLWPLCLLILWDRPRARWAVFALIGAAAVAYTLPGHRPAWAGLFQLGILAAPPLLYFGYNGKPGSRHPFHKWFFYAFYRRTCWRWRGSGRL